MTNSYYNTTGNPASNSTLTSLNIRTEFSLVGTAFDKLPTLTGNGGRHVLIASGETTLAASTLVSETGSTLTLAGAVTGVTDLTTTGNTILGNAQGDTLNVSGNVGIGVAPTNLYAAGRSIDLLSGHKLYGSSTTAAYMQNVTLDVSGNSFYQNTGPASRYQMDGGAHAWSNASPGIAGAAISFVDQMRIDATGNVGIGTASPDARLDVAAASGQVNMIVRASAGNVAVLNVIGNAQTKGVTSLDLLQDGANGGHLFNRANSFLAFGTNNAERARIDAAGNIGLFGAVPQAWSTIFGANLGAYGALYDWSGGLTGVAGNAYYNGSNWVYKSTNRATRHEYGPGNDGHTFQVAPAGSAGATITWRDALNVAVAGNVTIAAPTSGFHSIAGPNAGGTALAVASAVGVGVALSTSSANAAARNWGLLSNVTAFGDFAIAQGATIGSDPYAGNQAIYISPNRNVTIAAPSSGVGLTVGGGGAAVTGAITATTSVTVASGQSALANYLQDQTWNPAIVGTSSAGAASSPTWPEGRYTRVGKLVFGNVVAKYTTHTGVGALQFPLPVAAASATEDRCIGSGFTRASSGPDANPHSVVVVIPSGVTTYCVMYWSQVATSNQAKTVDAFPVTAVWTLQIAYHVA